MEHLAEAAAVRRGVVRLGRRLRQERGEGSLSPNELGVLGHLSRHGHATPGEIAGAERQRPQSLTRVFAELEAEGLIAREAGTVDRRRSVLRLTETGLRALERDMADRDAWLAGALASLGETERGVLVLASAIMERLAHGDPTGDRP
ncbi:MarR family transcriptional regulator [Streptomyces sp. NPDC093228]|uniref:MarR family winged helix-turn-helix transcriptional regulator n=1 Tax=unclassified Streptomyces TaxID=2593676 RepID=UPI00074104E1|nr:MULTISPECIES: MarR family transcriptional regulator [unclassified Streptomyces]KUJ40153.1 MarR family transcriptional regulator [Streptomyces sp. NRRL F-5122]MDX3264498.1 MarR family transcriptional regulator [Streptomyces sp. MI02-2A]